jgi:hypothetical protein
MGRPPKVGGLRTIGNRDTEPESSALPTKKDGVYQFRSRNAAYRLGLRRRRILRGPDNEAVEEAPRSTDGTDSALDWVIFENNYFETPSKELAELICKSKGFGVGQLVWSLSDEKNEQDAAMERELRARIEARPDIAARVLRPSSEEDFKLPPPVA